MTVITEAAVMDAAGARGAERLKIRMQGGTAAPVTEILPPRLVLRQSTSLPLLV